MKKGSDYSMEVLKFHKRKRFDNSQKKVVERLGVLAMPALKYFARAIF